MRLDYFHERRILIDWRVTSKRQFIFLHIGFIAKSCCFFFLPPSHPHTPPPTRYMLCGIITYFGFVSYRLPTVTCESQCKWFPLSKTTNKTIFQETDIQHCCGILTNTGVRCFLAATKQLYDWFSSSVRLVVCRPSVRLSHLFSCDQAALWMVFSVCLSVCLSVCPSVRHTFLTMFPSSYHHEICRSYYHGPG